MVPQPQCVAHGSLIYPLHLFVNIEVELKFDHLSNKSSETLLPSRTSRPIDLGYCNYGRPLAKVS